MRWFLAHQGGWDEIALFVGPVAVAFVAVRLVEWRTRRKQDESGDDHRDDTAGT